MPDARSIITKIKEKQTPSAEELRWFSKGLADHSVSDAQAAAFAMAVTLNGLDETGLVALTSAMRDSGDRLSWKTDKPILDKHSTGGVGDCVSLVLAPLLAAADIYVPMISGRGLGHTGGTLDKLEAIPGTKVQLDKADLTRVLDRAGCAIVSATGNIAPADKRLYAIRDVSATIDCLELITASILSKKLAAGLEGLILDVKCGSGAFMKTKENAHVLAKALVDTSNLAGCKTTALISDMNEPLAPSIGNAVEVHDVMEVLVHSKDGRLKDLCLTLGAVLLTANGLAETAKDAYQRLSTLLDNGSAAERFSRMIAEMGGPLEFAENWQRYLPEAPVIFEVAAVQDGYVTGWDAEALGMISVNLGGGRKVETDTVNPAVGISDIVSIGTKLERKKPIAKIHATRIEAAEEAAKRVLSALVVGNAAPKPTKLILEKIA